MEKHKNLSIFVPHQGCPNQCSFCDQKKISGTQNPPSAKQVSQLCDEFLPQDRSAGQSYEIAFFGGSFTAIDRNYMIELLQAAYPFVKQGRAVGIRISTRPDAINGEILEILKAYGVTSIELGAQSMQEDVLELNLRDHSVKAVYEASKLIKAYGFSLGLQMMTGLYGQKDYMAYALDTATQFVKIHPDTVRIYPTITLKDTLLADLYENGSYIPPSLEESVDICAKVSRIFEENKIKIIKLGLHADVSLENGMVAGPYHPAFKELVQSQIYLQKFIEDLKCKPKGKYIIAVCPQRLSQCIGQKKSNLAALKSLGYEVKFIIDDTLKCEEYKIISEEKQCI